jgi:sugar phosphate isomerase/epimerase
MPDLSRCSIHTMTTKPWSLQQSVDGYRRAGVPGITVWRQHLQAAGVAAGAKILRESGLAVTALCRGGFFPATDAAGRAKALDDNRQAIDEAAAVGAPMVVLVCGAVPGMPLATARQQIADGIAAVLPHAKAAGVRLAIEPLHPQYAGDRSAVSTMAQAAAICRQFDDTIATATPCDRKLVGIAVDVYHVWWDDQLEDQIAIAGAQGWLHGFHVCDWKLQQTDMLNDRGLMGEGCIDIPTIRAWVERAGFRGFNEVEIFSTANWAGDQDAWVRRCVEAYRAKV